MINTPENIIHKLKLALKGNLPGSKSHSKMIPPQRELEILPEIKLQVKESSVLIILYPDKLLINSILIKRTITMNNHAGQIAFPGGVIDQTDKTPLAAAIREANEEVGIEPETIEIIGRLSQLYVQVSNFLIYPFIGWCKTKPALYPNNFEVDKIIEFPLSNYIFHNKTSKFNIQTKTGLLNVPCYKFNDEIIWGATAMIITELLDLFRLTAPTKE